MGVVFLVSSSFVVYPNLPGYTYTWTITGGLPGSVAGNPVTILWGGGSTGSISVTITNGSGCTKTITRAICLRDKPIANFTFSPATNICTGTNITFTNTSSGGSSYTWYFGDGTSSQLVNPQHQYGSPNTYTVTLVVSNAGAGGANGNPAGGSCGCVDTIKQIIVVGSGPGITTCNKMICPKDTAIYCSTTTCSSYLWTISGGIIHGANNQNCVKVTWNTAPGSLTLTTSGCGPCNTNTIVPNVIWTTLPYSGPTTVCVGSTNTYSLPTIPGTFYSWSISPGGANILNGGAYPNNFPVNNPMVNVSFPIPGTYTLTCNYNNPNTKKNCGGTTNIIITVKPKFNISGPNPACQNTPGFYATTDGSSAVWTVTGQAGGFSPLTFPNGPVINVNWLLPGSYVMTAVPVTGANYCNPAGVTITILVKPSPILSFVTPQTVVCTNGITNYTVTSNVTGNVTWMFLTGTGNINPYGTDNTSASVQFTGTGPWTLQASQTVNGCSGNATVNVTKVPPPPVPTITPAGSICPGQTVTVSVTGVVPPGGYVWSATPGAVYVSGQGTTSATYVINSNATISITNCSGTSSVNATVSAPTVTASFVTGTCSAVITASAGALTYNWFLNGNPAGSGNPVTVFQNGTYVLQATYAGGCIATTSVTVTGITPVVALITSSGSLCNGGSVTLTAVMQGNCPGAVYSWSNGGGGSTHVVNAPGTYFVTVTCGGCTVISNAIQVYPCPSGNGNGNCIADLVIANSPCNNPMTFTVTGSPCGGPYNWFYGDGFSDNTASHTYSNIGNYTVLVSRTCPDGSVHCGIKNIQIPFVDSFTRVISCGINGWTVQLQDASLSLIGFGYTPSWTTSCGTLSANNIPNPVLTIPFGCNPTITLTITIAGCTYTKSFNYNLPATPLSINFPPVICKGQSNSYSSSYTTGVISYNWNFGDATTGTTNPINHVYDGLTPNPTITLTIKDQYGCIFTATQTVNVIIPPPLTINPGPIVKLCPSCQPPVTLTTSPLVGFSGFQWYHNGSAIGGANNPTYQLSCIGNPTGSYYVTAISSTGPCPITSDTVNVVYNPLPDAIIHPRTIQCAGSFPYNVSSVIYSGLAYNANYTYTWYLNNTGNQIYTTTTTNYLNYSVTAAGCYVFIVKVTDNVTGCYAYDTACICFSPSPVVTISPAGGACAGTPQTFTATAGPLAPALYTYVWQDGTPGQTYTTPFAGIYTVIAADKYGCNSSASTFIKPLPYVELFPQGCDTLCDTAHLYFPIPLTTFGTPSYTITWYEGVTVIGTGFSIPIIGLGLGAHTIHATVVMNGCTAITANLYLFIKHCGECDCTGSHWGEISLIDITGIPVIMKCKSNYTLECNKPYTINAAFNCKDTSCPAKVTYSLQPPTGLPVTGNMPLTFTPNQNGVYVLTIYGWCGNKICDSCIIDLTVKCSPCDCKGSKWGDIVLTQDNGGGNPGMVANIPVPLKLKCNGTYKLECNKPVTINANFICKDTSCPGKVTYSLQPPTGSPITGNAPVTFTPNQTGTYVLILYGWCGDKICDSCIIKFTVNCVDCCKGSHWGEIILNQGDGGGNPAGAKANIPVQQVLNCGGNYKLECKKPVTITANFICVDPACPAKVTYSLQPPTGSPLTGNAPLTFTPTQTGTYVLTLYGWCGNKICDSCIIKFDVTCVETCDCAGSHWGEMSITSNGATKPLVCNKQYDLKCKQTFTINAAYNCAKPACPGSVTYLLTPPSGFPLSGNVPLTYTPTQSGNYTLVLYGWCGNKKCDSCIIRFKVGPCDTSSCCTYTIKIDAGNVTYTPTANATIANQTFTITGMPPSLSEVRAEVLSYDISSNYNNECLGCKTFPFTWASINSATNIVAVVPKITLFGGATAPLFNPTGAAVYQNPREVIWNNGTIFSIGAPIGINFILPPQPVIDCCELKGKICVKFTFRDDQCHECEVVVCFDVVIKKK